MQLRDYQQVAIDKVRKSFSLSHKSVLLVLPTGAGKTVIFSQITKLAKSKGSNVLILVHRKELIDQAGDKLAKADVKYGIIAAGYEESNNNVQIASVQTLINRLNKPNQYDLIIIDEAHHAVANSWRKIFDFYKSAIKLGVTATPMRMTGAGLGEIFDDLIIASTIPELVEQGYLAEHEVYAPPNNLNLDRIKTIRGDFSQKEVENELNKVDIVGDAVENYKRLGQNKPAIAFCISVKHGQYVTNKFKNAGYTAELISGSMNSDDRKILIDNFKNGKIQILVSINVVSEGFDVEGCYVAILLRPTQSESLYLQQVGRVLRPEHNKVAIVLDHVGNTKRHGFVDEYREFDLHQAAKTKRKGVVAPSLETCQQCFAVYKPQPICPVCGHKREISKKEITYEDGELVKIKKDLLLNEGDPIIEKSTGTRFYFYAWSDDTKKLGFKFNLEDLVPFAKCFTEQQWKEYTSENLHNIFSDDTDYKRKIKTNIFLKSHHLAKININDIAVIRNEQLNRRKKEEWQCKTLKDWYKLAEKRGHKPFWAKKRWEMRRKKRKQRQKYPLDPLPDGVYNIREACKKLGYSGTPSTLYRLLNQGILEDYCYYRDNKRYLIIEPLNLPTLAEKVYQNIQLKKSNVNFNKNDYELKKKQKEIKEEKKRKEKLLPIGVYSISESARILGYQSSSYIHRLISQGVLDDYCFKRGDSVKGLILEPPNLPTLGEKIINNRRYKKINIKTNNYNE